MQKSCQDKPKSKYYTTLHQADLRFYKILRKVALKKGTKLSYIVATRQALDEVEWNVEKRYRSSTFPISLSSPFYNIFTKLTIPLFSEDEARKLVSNCLESTNLSFGAKINFWLQHNLLFRLSGFHPFFLEIVCYHLFEYCIFSDKTSISDISDVPEDKIISAFLDEAGAFFDYYWNVSSDEEKEVMRWLSKDLPIDSQRYSSILKILEERCLIIKDGKNTNIFSSAFMMWIEKKYSYKRINYLIIDGRQYTLHGLNLLLVEWANNSSLGKMMYTKSGLDAQSLFKALSKENIEGQSIEARKVIQKLWYSYPEFGPYPFLDTFSEMEHMGFFFGDYRDHVIHQLKVFLLGLYIFDQCQRIKTAVLAEIGNDDPVAEFLKRWTICALSHDIGYVLENEYALNSDESAWINMKKVMEKVLSSPISVLNEFSRKELLNKDEEKLICKDNQIPDFEILSDYDLEYVNQNDMLDKIAEWGKKANMGTSDSIFRTLYNYALSHDPDPPKRKRFRDHGIASAFLLFQTWYQYSQRVEYFCEIDHPLLHQKAKKELIDLKEKIKATELAIVHVAGAIALHNITPSLWTKYYDDMMGNGLNLRQFCIRLDNSDKALPFAFLLMLADALQEWDRYRYRAMKSSDKPSIDDRNFMVSIENEQIYLDYREDDKYKDPSKVSESKFSKSKENFREYLDPDAVDKLIQWKKMISDSDEGNNKGIFETERLIESPSNAQFMKELGLEWNPFERTDSNKEPFLAEYFVEPGIFEQLKALKSSILFASEGWGKTACCRMLEYVCKNKIDILKNIVTVNYDDSDFKKNFGKYTSLGYDYLFVLMDNVDNLFEIKKIIESIRLNKKIYFKLFLPSELQEYVNKFEFFKSFEQIHLQWQKENLKEILERRLQAATEDFMGIQINSLTQASGGRLSDKIDDIIIGKSESPRKLIKYCQNIFELLKKGYYNYNEILKLLFSDEEYEESEEYKPESPLLTEFKTVHILHISDIHLQKSADAQIYQSQLLTDLVKDIKIDYLDYVVITGDIAHFSTGAEYNAAFEFIYNIMRHFSLESHKIIMIPGNHDLNWKLSKKAYFECRKNESKKLPAGKYTLIKDDNINTDALLRNDGLHCERFKFFADFYKRIFKKPYPLNYEQQGILHIFPDHKLIFLTLNSCWEIDHLFKDKASININALSNALNNLLQKEKEYHDWLKIALWHHPIKMMKDDFMQQLAIHGFEICMHGHIHEASQDFYFYDPKRGIHIIGAGTFGAPAKKIVTGIPYYYNLLIYDKQKKKITVKTRKKEKPEGAWMADARWGNRYNPLPYYEIPIS